MPVTGIFPLNSEGTEGNIWDGLSDKKGGYLLLQRLCSPESDNIVMIIITNNTALYFLVLPSVHMLLRINVRRNSEQCRMISENHVAEETLQTSTQGFFKRTFSLNKVKKLRNLHRTCFFTAFSFLLFLPRIGILLFVLTKLCFEHSQFAYTQMSIYICIFCPKLLYNPYL